MENRQLMRQMLVCLLVALVSGLQLSAQTSYEEVWIYPDGKYPELNGHEQDQPRSTDRWTAQPYMHIYRADESVNTGRTVVCLPGGGYTHLSLQNEGSLWAPFFNEQGINLVVLAYRMPYGHDQIPQSDVYDGIRYLKANASRLGIDTDQVGVMGFSAGGHLATTVATRAPRDVRPAFQILFYPVVSMDTLQTHRGSHDSLIGRYAGDSLVTLYSNELQVDSLTPPAILLLADDDRAVPSPNAVNYYLALHAEGIPASMHIYPKGGHGFGIRDTFPSHEAMLSELREWLRRLKL